MKISEYPSGVNIELRVYNTEHTVYSYFPCVNVNADPECPLLNTVDQSQLILVYNMFKRGHKNLKKSSVQCTY